MLRQGSRSTVIQSLSHHAKRASSSLWGASSEGLSQDVTHPPKRNHRYQNWKDTKPGYSDRTPRQKWTQRGRKDSGKEPRKYQGRSSRDRISTIPTQIRSTQKVAFDQSSPDTLGREEEGFEDIEILPGAFIATRRNGIMTLGVALGYTYDATRAQLLMFSPQGEIWMPYLTDVTFHLPSFIPTNLIARCGLGNIAADSKELLARAEVLKRLRALIHELEERGSEISVDNFVYDTVKAVDPSASTTVSVAEVARMLEDNPRFHTIFSVHHQLMSDSLHYIARDPYLETQTFDVRPQEEVALIEKIVGWGRSSDPRLKAFAEKAGPLVTQTAQRVKESALEPPQMLGSETIWNEDDAEIIKFLRKSMRQTRTNQVDPYLITRALILRLLKVPTEFIEDSDLLCTLVNLGVVSPWQDPAVIQSEKNEPEYDPNCPRLALSKERLARSLQSKPKPGAPLGPEDFYSTDPLESVRHDFGDLPVFVIDAESAQELDDGIAIERIPSEPGAFWVHAHVANPTATLPPSHIFAQEALRNSTTEYYQHHSIPLFPPELTHHPDLGWSLGSQKGKASRTMTFSAKLDAGGEIVDYKVRAGLVNNVRVISYAAVNKILGTDPVALGKITRPFGGPVARNPPTVTVPSLPERELQDLRDLYSVMELLLKNWCDKNVARFAQHKATAVFGEFPQGSMTPSNQYRNFRGFPEFQDFFVTQEADAMGAEGMVAEIMKVAGRVASRYATDHNLPYIRRALGDPTFVSPQHAEYLKTVRSEVGSIYMRDAVDKVACLPSAAYTLDPRAHSHVGAVEGEGYSRVTSPLRRSLDLVGHWQLHRSLLGQHATTSKPMFDRDWMDNFKTTFGGAERTIKRLSNQHDKFWVAMFYSKWMKGELRGEGWRPYSPDITFEGHVLNAGWVNPFSSEREYDVELPEIGASVRMTVASLQQKLNSGDKIRARLKKVDPSVVSQMIFEHVP